MSGFTVADSRISSIRTCHSASHEFGLRHSQGGSLSSEGGFCVEHIREGGELLGVAILEDGCCSFGLEDRLCSNLDFLQPCGL